MEAAIKTLLEHPGFREGSHWHRRQVAAREDVFKEGDAGRDVYYVLSGTLRVVGAVDIAEDRKIRPGISELPVGSVFGELALFDSGPRSATVTAVEDAELAVIHGEQLLDFFDTHPDWGYRMLREMLTVVVGRMRTTNRKLVSLFAWGLKAHHIDDHL